MMLKLTCIQIIFYIMNELSGILIQEDQFFGY